ncbi:C1 family peptidase [Prolixibacteraceae bacterium]|nr:C1 family peptidase [Prolixibacteraceae bacterium]
MIKKSFGLGCLLALSSVVFGQKQGELTKADIQEIRASYKKDSYTKAMENALSSNDVKSIAYNRDNAGKFDHHFKYKVDVKGITDQESSGRCWLFTSLNVFRPKVMDAYDTSSFEFSQVYLSFWDLFEKSNLFLNNIIETAKDPITDREVRWYFDEVIGDGGVWNLFVNVAQKYGAVPKSVMPETHSSNNTRWMNKLVIRKLREDGIRLRQAAENGAKKKELYAQKKGMMKDIYRMLCLNMGEPVKEFEWRFKKKDGSLSELKTYTPHSFYDEVIGKESLSDYVMIMNDPTRPYYKLYEISNYRNTEEGVNWKYVNLPNDVIKKFAVESIKDNQAMYASCDVGKQIDSKHGILDTNNYDYDSVYGVEFGMNKKERIFTRESGSSHAMTLVAVDVDANENPLKWQFENSWGANSGHKGYLAFSDDWFDNYMFRIVIKKKYLDQKSLDVLNKKPVVLPPWDFMY